MIQPHPSWYVLDPSKIGDMQRCPRYYFYRHMIGWEYDKGPNLDLVFGESWHLAKEFILVHGLSNDSIAAAISVLTDRYRLSFPIDMDIANYPKTPGGALESLIIYQQTYEKNMGFHVIELNGIQATEIYGTVPIAEDRRMHFRIDAIGEVENGSIAYMDHKTSGMDSPAYQAQWHLSMQMLCYLHVINCLFEGRVYGGIVDLSIFRKKDKMHIRIPIRKTVEAMSEWLYLANYWYDQVEIEIDNLMKCKEDSRVMTSFPRNEKGCTAYNRRCRYYDFCLAWQNPLSRINTPPDGFVEEHWDPGKKEKEAKQFVEI